MDDEVALLDSIFGKTEDILKLPLEEQATYCDQVCAEHCELGSDFIKDQILNYDESNPCFEEWNSTSIGNIAKIIVTFQETEPIVSEKAIRILNKFIDNYNNKASHQIIMMMMMMMMMMMIIIYRNQ